MADPNTPPTDGVVAMPFTFSAQAKSVHATVDDALATIPEGKRGVFLAKVTKTADGETASVGTAMRIGGNWELAAGAGWDTAHGPSAVVAVIDSW